MHLALCLSAISIMFVKIMFSVCRLVGMVVRAKADSVPSMSCVSFLIVGEGPSVLL